MTDTKKPRAWLTYAWKDNEGPNQGDVDYLIQEIGARGIDVRYDRRDLVAGRRLWEQLDTKISDSTESDAWIFVVTATSLASQPCREELAFALDRALSKRGAGFPLIGLVHGPVPGDLPAALRVRLWVSTDREGWAEGVASGVRGVPPPSGGAPVQPFAGSLTRLGDRFVFEVRPRVGVWAPFIFGLPKGEADRYLGATYAPTGCANAGCMTSPLGEWEEAGLLWRGVSNPTVGHGTCAHIFLRLESGKDIKIRFGQRGGALFEANLVV